MDWDLERGRACRRMQRTHVLWLLLPKLFVGSEMLSRSLCRTAQAWRLGCALSRPIRAVPRRGLRHPRSWASFSLSPSPAYSTTYQVGALGAAAGRADASPDWQAGDKAYVSLPADGGPYREVRVLEGRTANGWVRVAVLADGISRSVRVSQLHTGPPSSASGQQAVAAEEKSGTAESSGEEVGAGVESTLLPPPTLVDLDADVLAWERGLDPALSPQHEERMRQVRHHRRYDRWVVFTDLHCAPDTLDASLQVLERVRTCAAERGAGVLFLGDFWHHRGTLRVDCLNAVLEHLRSWTAPLVMIPGNHDQVTLGGLLHSLTPLENAFRIGVGGTEKEGVPGPLVLSRPTKFRSALLVPHIRDPATLESVVRSELAQSCDALLVHADVTGACMNDLIVSTGGIPPSAFPIGKHVYSGHFHKPHIVVSAGRTIEYLGSPYQVSLAEAHQPKALAVLDATNGWRCVERIPIDLGRRHFKVSRLSDFLALQVEAVREEQERGTEEECDSRAATVRSGDRVVFTPEAGDEGAAATGGAAARSHATALRKAGLAVEIRDATAGARAVHTQNAGDTSGAVEAEAEELTTESALRAFLSAEVGRGVYSAETAENLAKIGLELLDEMASEQGGAFNAGATADLVLTEVSVEGFGPFQGRVTYPLWNRGLVLLRGENRDGGSDSNGSGKSSLAMASLWCLTGSLDSRPSHDYKVSDVLNDGAKVAKVTVRGRLNGVHFSVTRSKAASRTGLVFLFGDEDLTAQSFKETQVILEERLGFPLQLLRRVIFQGQHSLNGLLEATDTELKDQLSLVVPLAVWHAAAAMARKKTSLAKKRANELEGMLSIRIVDRDKAQKVANEARSSWEALEEEWTEHKTQLSDQLPEFAPGPTSPLIIESFSELERRVDEAATVVEQLQLEHEARKSAHGSSIRPLQLRYQELEDRLKSLDNVADALARDRMTCASRVAQVRDRLEVLEHSWGLKLLSARMPDVIPLPEACPTCHQPIGASVEGHSHTQRLRDSIRSDASTLLLALEQAESELVEVDTAVSRNQSEREAVLDVLRDVRHDLDRELSLWNSYEQEHSDLVRSARAEHGEAIRRLAKSARHAEESARRARLQSELDRAEASLQSAKQSAVHAQEELGRLESEVSDLQGRLDQELGSVSALSDLADVLGPRGVPTFVLKSAVQALQRLAQHYLNELSDGSLRLHLEVEPGDRLTRRAMVRMADGEYRDRSLSSLSGGQWRRCSLALALGYAHWVSRRETLRASVLFLDEPLTHLDRSGRARVGALLRRLLAPAPGEVSSSPNSSAAGPWQVSTVVVILQDLAAEELEEAFDGIDLVIKENGSSSLQVDYGR